MSRNGGKDRKNKGTLRFNFSDESDDADFMKQEHELHNLKGE